ncbi:hypothetical protein HDU85_004906 [Gaertneriomyces sp. JEL0708]|nr:hypothetical protein HDU85_004906 [Gaertneriomyces sp. JEL0708]
MNVKTALLKGKEDAELYAEQPERVPTEFPPKTHVCKLKKGMYGRKEALQRCHEYLQAAGFKQLDNDPCVYTWQKEVLLPSDGESDKQMSAASVKLGRIFVAVYVGDIPIATQRKQDMESTKRSYLWVASAFLAAIVEGAAPEVTWPTGDRVGGVVICDGKTTFTVTTTRAWTGVTFINCPPIVIAADSVTLTFEDCVIDGGTSATWPDTIPRAFIRVAGIGSGIVATRTSFLNTVTGDDGFIRLVNGTSFQGTEVVFRNNSNSAIGGGGSSLSAEGSAANPTTVSCTGCLFDSNGHPQFSRYATVYLNRNVALTLTSSNFTNNIVNTTESNGTLSSSAAGLFLRNGATGTGTNLFFSNNKGWSGGAMALQDVGTSFACTDCDFENDISYHQGGAVKVAKGSSFTWNGGSCVGTSAVNRGSCVMIEGEKGKVTIASIKNVLMRDFKTRTAIQTLGQGTVVAQGVTIKDAVATGQSGLAMAGPGYWNVTDCVFKNLRGASGAISMESSASDKNVAFLDNVLFQNIRMGGPGGAVSARGPLTEMTMKNGIATDVSTTDKGGFAAVREGAKLYVYATTVEATSVGNGAAIYVNASTFGCYTTTSFRRPADSVVTSSIGGAIYANASSSILLADDCSISEYSATTDGGGIFLQSSSLSISGNVVLSAMRAASRGGAIYASPSSTITMSGSAMISDAAATLDGGAIYLEEATLNVIDDVSLSNSRASRHGGAIYAGASSTISMSGTAKVEDTAATEDGGVIYTDASTVTIGDNVTFSKSRAGRDGGAIYAGSSSVTLTGTTQIHDSAALSNGGIIYALKAATVSIDRNVKLYHATAGVNGGVLYGSQSTVTIDGNAQLYDSKATRYGGVIFNTLAGNITIKGNAAISHGTAGIGGGGITSDDLDSNINIRESALIQSSTAGTCGGGVDTAADFYLFDTAHIRWNDAPCGTAVCIRNSTGVGTFWQDAGTTVVGTVDHLFANGVCNWVPEPEELAPTTTEELVRTTDDPATIGPAYEATAEPTPDNVAIATTEELVRTTGDPATMGPAYEATAEPTPANVAIATIEEPATTATEELMITTTSTTEELAIATDSTTDITTSTTACTTTPTTTTAIDTEPTDPTTSDAESEPTTTAAAAELTPPPPPPHQLPEAPSNSRTAVIAGILGGGATIAALSGVIIFAWSRNNKRRSDAYLVGAGLRIGQENPLYISPVVMKENPVYDANADDVESMDHRTNVDSEG